jgi:hypothetical protein
MNEEDTFRILKRAAYRQVAAAVLEATRGPTTLDTLTIAHERIIEEMGWTIEEYDKENVRQWQIWNDRR